MNKSKKAILQHQLQFKKLVLTHPISQLLTIKNIKLSDSEYKTLETKYASYREFPISNNSFFRVFYVEIFRVLIRKNPEFNNFKQNLDNLLCFEQMVECQLFCKYVYKISELKAIYEKILKIIFNGKATCDPEVGYQNFLAALSLDLEIDKFGLLTIRGNLYKWSLSVTQPEDECTSWLVASRRLFEKLIKNPQEQCDNELIYQSIAVRVFELPLGKVPSESKRVKIKLISRSGVFALLEKKKESHLNKLQEQLGIIRTYSQTPHNQSQALDSERPQTAREQPQKQQSFEDNLIKDQVIQGGSLTNREQQLTSREREPIEEAVEENKYDPSEKEHDNFDGMISLNSHRAGMTKNIIASLKYAADGIRGCRHCGSSDLVASKKVCPSCYDICDICLSDSPELLRYNCSHSFCFLCINNIVITLNDYKPKTCPTCYGLG